MDCHTARASLWPPERPRLLDEDETQARSHVASCAACARFLAQDRTLLDALDTLRGERAPLEVRERIFQALAAARTGAPHHTRGRSQARMTSWAGAAVGLSLILGSAVVALGARSRSPTPTTQGAVAEDYLRRTVSEDYLDTSDPREVVRFLERELGTVLSPLHGEHLTILRVEICLLDGTRGAMILYLMNGERVSHYIVPTRQTRARAPAMAQGQVGRPGETLPVVTWATSAVEQALVGAVDPRDLLALARTATRR